MSDISELMTITRKRLVSDSEFDSSYGIDEELLSSMQDVSFQVSSRAEAKEKLHPTVSELWICDIGCGIQVVLPYIKGIEQLSKGEELFYPLDTAGYRGQPMPPKKYPLIWNHKLTKKVELEHKLNVKDLDGIEANRVKVIGFFKPSLGDDYLYAIGNFIPGQRVLSGLSLIYGQNNEPFLNQLLDIDIRYEPRKGYIATDTITADSKFINCCIELKSDGSVNTINLNGSLPDGVSNASEYIIRLAKDRKLEGIYGPLLEGAKVDFYKTTKALVAFCLDNKGRLNEVLKFEK
jgi:hypothetical protein